MTDNTASNPAPTPQDQPCPDYHPSNPMASPSASEPSPTWEVVNFPGQMAIAEAQATASTTASPTAAAAASAPLHRTEELIQLIQDLNQCNDALLIRVSDLEESLERSQAALQAEIERNQAQGAMASARSPVPTQVAQLLSELDAANDGLRRATIHNETLQAELESSQQRVAQLERECTLLQQRFSEKSTALQQAEDSCRDLKARLHRQQRYTLQFKTALEKCLNMAKEPQPTAIPAAVGLGMVDNQPVTLPKAQEIQPWTAPSVAAHAQADALSNLIHSLKPTAAPVSSAPVSAPEPTATPEPTLPDTWPQPAAAVAAPSVPEAPAIADPWLAPAQPDDEPAPSFTEPSPWGSPVRSTATPLETAAQNSAPVADVPTPVQARPVVQTAPAEPALAVSAPSLAAATSASYPQRSPRKISSLAAVQLPSFGRSPRRS